MSINPENIFRLIELPIRTWVDQVFLDNDDNGKALLSDLVAGRNAETSDATHESVGILMQALENPGRLFLSSPDNPSEQEKSKIRLLIRLVILDELNKRGVLENGAPWLVDQRAFIQQDWQNILGEEDSSSERHHLRTNEERPHNFNVFQVFMRFMLTKFGPFAALSIFLDCLLSPVLTLLCISALSSNESGASELANDTLAFMGVNTGMGAVSGIVYAVSAHHEQREWRIRMETVAHHVPADIESHGAGSVPTLNELIEALLDSLVPPPPQETMQLT